ncbi:hypothetical protein AB0L04_01825 [Streptomyces glaucescens]|uniref:hypothetical protein n=1 Tax=Streptomyces glaucescens TaxID=1907 RepID=UPI00344D9012
MSGEEHEETARHGDGEREFEERVRALLADDAFTIRPSAAPYPAIRRRGVAERRRRAATVGAALVTLAVVPVGAAALTGPEGGGRAVSPAASATPAPSPTPAAPAGPAGPASDAQLLDGVTRESAAAMLEDCLASDRGGGSLQDLGAAEEYRILLGMRSTGDSNAPGDGRFVVAVRDEAPRTRVICNIKDGEVAGLNVGGADTALPDQGKVMPDVNAHKLYSQSFLDKGDWRLPFRWGSIGAVHPSVARVTVSYGDAEPRTAVIDHGWFVATGVLDQQVTRAPHIKGYDTAGRQVYDSDQDKYYLADLP